MLLIAIGLAASHGSRRSSPPPVAGTPPQDVSAPSVAVQPAAVLPQPPARPACEPEAQLAASLGQEILFHGVAVRLPQEMEEMQDLPPMHPRPKAEQEGYHAMLSGDMQPSVVIVEYIPRMMAGPRPIRVTAVEQELRTAFVYGLQASDVQSEIGMVGEAEVVRFRFRGLFEGAEYWYQVVCLPHEDGVVLLISVTAVPPDSASYKLVECRLLTFRRISDGCKIAWPRGRCAARSMGCMGHRPRYSTGNRPQYCMHNGSQRCTADWPPVSWPIGPSLCGYVRDGCRAGQAQGSKQRTFREERARLPVKWPAVQNTTEMSRKNASLFC